MRKPVFFILLGAITLMLIALVTVFILMGPIRGQEFSRIVELPPADAGFVLISPDFTNGGLIPTRYTCNGEDIPPTLAWGEPPVGTASYVLIVEDPDAPLGTWTHWIVYNIPPGEHIVDSQIQPGTQIDDVPILFGKNSWGRQAYGGPCPPSGTHHYVFQLFALDIMLEPKDNVSRNELASMIEGHILGFAEITGIYTK